jgi:hypothetical protein
MKYFTYVKRENNIYYRRRRRAVASHTRWGERNPNALSSNLKGEAYMRAEDRKSAELPCGYTIAESWAALRKCWLGFNITKSQGDIQGMGYYAYRIRKIQAEMSIKPTDFDSEILDENTVNGIDKMYRKSPPSYQEAVKNSEQQTDESNDLDYGRIMDGLNSNSQSMPAPRQEIFATYLSRDNSCPSPAYQSDSDVAEVSDHEKSCYIGPPQPADQSQEHVKEIKTIYKKQRQSPRTKQNNFAVSGPENTLAVPDPNRPPIEPILRGNTCAYQPAKDPAHPIYKDKSCPSDPQVNQTQRNRKEKVIQRKPKSCPYTNQI